MSDSDKKEFTSLMDYSKKVEETEGLPSPPGGESVMEESPQEKISDFESLDEYSKSNPAAEAPPESLAESPAESLAPETDAFPTAQDEGPAQSQAMDFSAPSSPNVAPGDFAAAELSHAVTGAMDEHPLGAEGTDAKVPFTPSSAPELIAEESGMPTMPESPAAADAAPATVETASFDIAPPEEEEPSPSQLSPVPEAPFKAPTAAPESPRVLPTPSMAQVKAYTEGAPVARTAAPAAYPFTLKIEGRLAPEEREKLLHLLTRHQFGIREVDLEPQFEAGRILIPRISEYAGVLLIQNLRTLTARMTFGPSDSVFASEATREDAAESASRDSFEQQSAIYSHSSHPAEALPISQDERYPSEAGVLEALDVLSASAFLHSKTVEADHSSEYQEILDALQRELRYKAYHRGALALTQFKIQLAQLGTPTDYRLTVVATAMGPRSQAPALAPAKKLPPRPPKL